MVACRAADGLFFGTMRMADAGEIVLEVEAEIALDSDIAWQVEIPGVEDAVLGNARVRASGRNPRTGVRSYRASVTWVADDDRELWSAWLAAVSRGERGYSHARITSERFEAWKVGVRASLDPADRARQEALRAQRLEARAARLRELLALDPVAGDDVTPTPARGGPPGSSRSSPSNHSFSLAEKGFSDVSGRPREAMAAALRDRLGAMGKLPRPAGAAAGAPAAEGAGKRAPPPTAATTAAPTPALPDPEIEMDATGFAVTWRGHQSYARDYGRDLRASALRLEVTSPFSAGKSVSLRLCLPSGSVVATTAQVVAVSGGQTGLYLQLDRQARATLAAERPPPLAT